ncbi:MAG: hypothetical protein ACI37U_02635 [Bacteroides sp.]
MMIYIAIGVLAFVLCFQIYFTSETRRKIILVRRLFPKDGIKYRKDGLTVNLDENGLKCKELSEIIQEINVYLSKNEGTADFSILMHMVERRINVLYSDAVAKISFPTFCGLLGTFLGVFIGLFAFWLGLDSGMNTNNDSIQYTIQSSMIQELIEGVIVSMVTSVFGLLCSIGLNWFASNVKKVLDRRKNEFYHFLQTELLPELGTDMVSSIVKLRNTINCFEPAFSGVITRFEETFDHCTAQFGDAFRENVQVVAKAVTSMGENINKVNENIRYQQKILDSLKSRELNKTLDKFVSSINQLDELSQSLALFEQSKSEVILATQELTEAQRKYNDSLRIPTELVNDVNRLLDRIRTFEDNVNRLGEELMQSGVIGNQQLNLIENQLRVLKDKNAVASTYVEITTGELTTFFESQKESLKGKTKEWNRMLMNYGDEYENIVNQMQEQMQGRWKVFVNQMDNLFNTSDISTSLHQLKQLKPIFEKIEAIEAKLTDSNILAKNLNDIRVEVTNVNEAIKSAPTTSVQQSAAFDNSSNELSSKIVDSIQRSVHGMSSLMEVVSRMEQRVDEIKRIVEKSQQQQMKPNTSSDRFLQNQSPIAGQKETKRSQTESNVNKIYQGKTNVAPKKEDLKAEVDSKEEEKTPIKKIPWYKRII